MTTSRDACRLCLLVTSELNDAGMCLRHEDCMKLAVARIKGAVLDDMVDFAGIMALTGAGKSTVSMWATRSATNGFPDPLLVLPSTRLWSRAEVEQWFADRAATPCQSHSRAGTPRP